jgi:Protein of unknown function (DUF2889)
MLDEEGVAQLEPLHDRTYSVRVFRRDAERIVVLGMVHDEKPSGLYVADDPDPLTMHRMRVQLEIDFPALVINHAEVEFDDYPQVPCPMIADDYDALVGVSITRGFTHRVRELFGGPRGCAHVTALLQAMAPAVVQSTWSMGILAQRDAPAGDDASGAQSRQPPPADSCHVWASGGELVTMVERGGPVPTMLTVRTRLGELGRDPDGR